MKLNASAVKEKLQNEKDCVVFVYFDGDNFVYDTELKSDCIGKISGLQTGKNIVSQVEQKGLPDISNNIRADIRIRDITRVKEFMAFSDVENVVRRALLNTKVSISDDMLASSVNITDDLGFHSLDNIWFMQELETEMGISIPVWAIGTYFDGPKATIGNICQYLHQQVTKALGRTEH